jgi:CHASE2 domain-containing sensor protein
MKFIGRLSLVLILLIIGIGFSEVYINKIDYFSRDVLQYFNSDYNSKISQSITIVDINTNSDLFSNPISAKQIEALLQKIKEKNPKLIILSMEPNDFSNVDINNKSLYSVLNDHKAYLTTDKSKSTISSFATDPLFKDFKYKVDSNFCTDNSRGDFSPRRMFLKYYSNSPSYSISEKLNEISINTYPAKDFFYSFDRMNTQQIFNKFHSSEKFIKLSASEIIKNNYSENVINNKIVVVGRIDEFGLM